MLRYTPIPDHAVTPVMVNDILHALDTIERGQVVIYHTGLLALDRDKHEEIELVAERAYDLATRFINPKVNLVQYRTPHGYAYAAIGASGARSPSIH